MGRFLLILAGIVCFYGPIIYMFVQYTGGLK
jgi:hypothetical protein